MHRLAHIKKIDPKRTDPDQTKFLVDYEVRRQKKTGGWGKALKLTPKRGGTGRWDLRMALGKNKTVYYHRVVALSVCPVTTGKWGDEVEWYFADTGNMHRFEVHHGNPGTHDCRAHSLFVLWKEHHRSLRRVE